MPANAILLIRCSNPSFEHAIDRRRLDRLTMEVDELCPPSVFDLMCLFHLTAEVSQCRQWDYVFDLESQFIAPQEHSGRVFDRQISDQSLPAGA